LDRRRSHFRAAAGFGLPHSDRHRRAQPAGGSAAPGGLGAVFAPPEPPMIELSNLTKRYGRFTAVDGINLTIPAGELYGLLGPNGAGKTTTMRMIAGILQPTGGSIHIAGIDVRADPIGAKRLLGFIPDRPFVYDKLTGAEFLRFVAGLYGQDGAAIDRRIDELLELFELLPWRDE